MIRYALVCDKGHEFDAWFRSSSDFDTQARRGFVTCAVCNSAKVAKAIMAPRLARADRDVPLHVATEPAGPAAPEPPAAPQPVAILSEKERAFRDMLKAFREHVVQNSEDVGRRFPDEARKMHYNEKDLRSIRGVASPDEAQELREEGIEFHAMPVLPDERN